MPHPQTLGKYRITDVLGEGAMGVVYKGFDPGIGRTVALKTIRRHLLEGADSGQVIAARFRNEAQAAGRLMHPGIVAVYDFGDEGDVAYIAMEFVEGNTLARALAGGTRFAEDDMLSLMAQLLDALEHAHAHGVWHRDVKPANLLLAKDGRLKIADFGIARIESAALTQVTSVVGTPGFMAPEQFQGKGVDRRVDIYSAGVVLYHLLVGKPPFAGTTEALMYKVLNEPPALPSTLPGFEHLVPFDAVVATALAKEPNRRYPSAGAFKEALVAAAGRPVQATISSATLVEALRAKTRPPPPTPSTATHWDRAVLAQVEASLARHLGPLAGVLVKRAARECADLPSLYAKLAEQVTDPGARSAFVAQTGAGTGGAARSGGNSVLPPLPPAPEAGGPVTEALLAQSTRLLLAQLGPIATVVAKRAAARSRGRLAFFEALEAAVDDPRARAALRAELDKLG